MQCLPMVLCISLTEQVLFGTFTPSEVIDLYRTESSDLEVHTCTYSGHQVPLVKRAQYTSISTLTNRVYCDLFFYCVPVWMAGEEVASLPSKFPPENS